jgi:hypothetical protein
MTAPRSTDQLLEAFLTDGLTELPDRTYEAVRSDIHRTRQRAVLGPWKEPNVTTLYRLAIAAALVAAVGVAWWNFVPRPGGFGGIPTPSPSLAPSLAPSPIPIPEATSVPPGRYRFTWSQASAANGEVGPSIDITIPSAGWTSFAQFAVDKNYDLTTAGAGPSFVIWRISNRYTDGCVHATDGLLSPAPGGGIEELLMALANQRGITAGPLTPVTIDGYGGKYVELTVAIDIATCAGGQFYPWIDKFVQGNNEVLRVYALDVGASHPMTFFLRIPARTTAQDRAELMSVVDSIHIEP